MTFFLPSDLAGSLAWATITVASASFWRRFLFVNLLGFFFCHIALSTKPV
jgi:hypothetical protein